MPVPTPPCSALAAPVDEVAGAPLLLLGAFVLLEPLEPEEVVDAPEVEPLEDPEPVLEPEPVTLKPAPLHTLFWS